MKDFNKPTIIASKCLDNCPCRYNGEGINSKFLNKLKEYSNVITICPEESIGLGTPRNAIRLIKENDSIGVFDSKTFKDYTKLMTEFSSDFAIKATDLSPDGFLLKSRSPSCGVTDVKIYTSKEKGATTIKGKGLFASKIKDTFPALPIEDDGRLSNFNIREHYLTRIFTLATFKDVEIENSIKSLNRFHQCNKLLLMAYNQQGQKVLGNIVANHTNDDVDVVISSYKIVLQKVLSRQPRYKSIINMLNHCLGYFCENITNDEKEFFYSLLNDYRIGKSPYSVPLNVLKGYAVRFNNTYLLSQSIFEPYPQSLIDISDSGKGTVRD